MKSVLLLLLFLHIISTNIELASPYLSEYQVSFGDWSLVLFSIFSISFDVTFTTSKYSSISFVRSLALISFLSSKISLPYLSLAFLLTPCFYSSCFLFV